MLHRSVSIYVQQPVGLETFFHVINNTMQTYTMIVTVLYLLHLKKNTSFYAEEVMDEMWESQQHIGCCSHAPTVVNMNQ